MEDDDDPKRFHIPTRDSVTFSKEEDGGYTLNISLRRETFDRLAKNHRDTIQQIAALLLTMQSELDPAGVKPASVFD